MGMAIRSVWEFYVVHKKDNFISEYCEFYENGYYDVHYQRRMVTFFYQKMAALKYQKIIDQEIINTVWTKGDLSIIDKILIPIMREAMPKILGGPIVELDDMHISFKNMQKLYDEAED